MIHPNDMQTVAPGNAPAFAADKPDAAVCGGCSALYRSHDRFLRLFAEAPVAFVLLGETGLVEEVNARGLELLGGHRAEVVGRSLVSDIWSGASRDLTEHLRHPGRSGHVIASRALGDGGQQWLRVDSGPVVGADLRLRTLIVLTDVTGSRRDAESVRNSEARFRALFDAGQDAVALIEGVSLTLVEVNPALERLADIEADDVLGARISVLFPEDQRWAVAATVRQGLEHGQAGPLACAVLQGDERTTRRVELHVTAVQVQGGSFAMVTVRDMHDNWMGIQRRREAERRLWQVQRVELLGAMAAGVACDLHGVFDHIQGLAQGLDGDARDALVQACRKGWDLTQNLSGFSRSSDAVGGEVDLSTVLRQALERTPQLLGRTLSCDISTQPDAVVRGDAEQLTQVVLNLLCNAAEAAGVQGRVQARIDRVCLTEGEVDELPAGCFVRLRVTDPGGPVPPEVLARAFDPFFTTKGPQQGTGLGLALARVAIEDHKGHIELDSEPGVGTTATVWLPHHRSDQVLPLQPVGTALHVVLVDPDALVLRASARMLSAAGYRVTPFLRLEQVLEGRSELTDVDAVLFAADDRHVQDLLDQASGCERKVTLLATTSRAEQISPALRQRLGGVVNKPFDGEDVRRLLAVR